MRSTSVMIAYPCFGPSLSATRMYRDGSAKRPSSGISLVMSICLRVGSLVYIARRYKHRGRAASRCDRERPGHPPERGSSGTITAHAILAPLPPFPASVTWSSRLAWMMNADPSVSKRVAVPGLVDDQVRQIAGVRPVRVLQAVLISKRLVVDTGAREGGCHA